MKFLLKLVEAITRILGGRKKEAKKMGNIPKDNYPMF